MLAGLFDSLQQTGSSLWGFVGGLQGLLRGEVVQLTASLVDSCRGQGGFGLLGRATDRLIGEEAVARVQVPALLMQAYKSHFSN